MPLMRPHDILMLDAAGLYCKPGGFHIDPVRPVDRAVITHGHSDHARPGHRAVLATQETLDIMRLRYGDDFAGSTQAISYGQEIRLGDVSITFHPAGLWDMPGASQAMAHMMAPGTHHALILFFDD